MQDGFFQKLMLSIIVAAVMAGLVEFYKTFIQGADQALNGRRPKTHFNATPPPKS